MNFTDLHFIFDIFIKTLVKMCAARQKSNAVRSHVWYKMLQYNAIGERY